MSTTKKQPYKPPHPSNTLYILRDIPRELWERAQAKAAGLRPPVPLRRILIALLEDWVGRPEVPGQTTDPVKGVKPTDHYPPVF